MMRANQDSDKLNVIAVAYQELQRRCALPFAFVISNSTVIFAQFQVAPERGQTPATVLLSCFFEEHQDLAFFVLRTKVHCSYKPTAFCYGMAKVVAKGIDQIESRPFEPPVGLNLNYCEVDYRFFEAIRKRRQAAQLSLEKSILLDINEVQQSIKRVWIQDANEANLHDQDRPVWAVALDADGMLVGSARNSNKFNKTQHAEINCLLDILSRPQGFPPPRTLVVSHKPCKMCAGLIWEACRNWKNFRVIFLVDEKGGLSSQTVLDLESHDRGLFATTAELYLNIQQKYKS